MINDKYPTTKPSLNLDFANTKSLDPRITFRRGTPGTYYDGVTHAKAEENLLNYSEDFSQWSKGDGSLVPQLISDVNNTSPSGGDMYKLVAGTTLNTQHWFSSQSTTKNATFSVYAKAAGYNYIWIGLFGTSYISIVADLTNGEFVSGGQDLDGVITGKNIVGVGDDWYRIDYSILSDSTFVALGGLSDPSTDIHSVNFPQFTGDGTSGIYIWGAQLEQRDSVTSYTATNGAPITKYQPKLMTASPDDARFDHDPITGESKGLLIEEQRTNLVQDSEFIEDISANGVWWNQSATVSSVEKNQTISPTGELNATKIIYNTNVTSGGLLMKYNPAVSVGDVLTASVYLKAGNLDKVRLFFNARSSSGTSIASPSVIVDLSLGVIESTVDSAGMTISDSSIHNVGNDWYRVTMTSTVITGVAVAGLIINMSGGPTNTTTAYDHFFVWGAQIEKASFATSYIKSSGATAGTVRSADNASITGENFSSWYRQDEGSIYCESYSYNDYVQRILNISDSSSNNRIVISAINSEQLLVKNNTNTEISIDAGSYTVGEFLKQGTAYKDDSFFVTLGGNSGSSIDRTDSTSDGSVPKSLNKLNIGCSEVNNFYLNGHIKKIAYYPQRLTNEQLQNLTK